MQRLAVAVVLGVVVLAGYPAVEAQTTPQPQTTPQGPTEPAQPPESREPAERGVPAEGRPLTPAGTDVLSLPRTDFLSRLLTGLQPGDTSPGWYVIPALSLTQIYNDNVFGRSSGREADFITQASPAVSVGYQSPELRIFGGYSTEAAWYADHSELSDAMQAQTGRLEFGYLPNPLLRLGADASYRKAQDTVRLTQETGVVAVDVGRRPLSVLSVASSATYQFSPLTSGTGTYSFTRSDIPATPTAPEFIQSQHSVGLRLNRELSPRDRATFGYVFNFFENQEGNLRDTSVSHDLLVGYARDFSPDTGVRLEVGPRFSRENEVGVDASAQLRQAFRFATVSLAYSRSQTVVVGLTGPRTTDTLSANIGFEPIFGPLGVGLTSRVSRSSGLRQEGTTDTLAYGAGAGINYPFSSWATLAANYEFSVTDGTDRISRHIVTIGINLSYPVRVR